ncbi:MAG: polysaccharide deacetylase family protein [Sphingobacteriales bacterium]|nr:MAG: polysaccharide deacetylase family protein [Sphingobacteriales bacterium]
MNLFERLLMPYWVAPPKFLTGLYPKLIWEIPDPEPSLYLTFDDGPTPEVTEWVLEKLDDYGAKSSFFCIGSKAKQHPEILEQVIKAGHSVGNHTHHHLHGWKTPLNEYIDDIRQCAEHVPSSLFRPPYGKITRAQTNYLLQNPEVFGTNQSTKIVMWSIVSADWMNQLPWQTCFKHVVSNVSLNSKPFSPVIVFHDSQKALYNLREVLPRILDYYHQKNFCFKAI